MEYDVTTTYVYRWDWRVLGFDIFVEVDCDSRVGRFLERRGF